MVSGPSGGPVLYSFSLGLVAACNPCGFPLLPAYLVLVGRPDGAGVGVRLARALAAGVAMTAGFVAVFAGLAAAIKGGVAVTLSWVPWAMIPLGAALAVVGVLAAAGRSLPVPLPRLRVPQGRGVAVTFGVFGVSYAVASLSCSLPLFLVGVVDPISSRGSAVGAAGGLAYALGMGLVVTSVSVASVASGSVRLLALRRLQPVLQRVGGAVLAAVGVYLVYYWVTTVVDPFARPGPIRWVEWLQGEAASALGASPRLTGVIVGGIVVVALAGVGVTTARHASSGVGEQSRGVG